MFETKKALKFLNENVDLCRRIGSMAEEYMAEWPDSPEEDIFEYIFDAFISETMNENGDSPYDEADEVKVSKEIVRISGIRI